MLKSVKVTPLLRIFHINAETVKKTSEKLQKPDKNN